MLTTHVGSLPFKDLQQALEYTYQWDIPALFTLPQRNDLEFMGIDLLKMLNIKGNSTKNSLELDQYFYKTDSHLIPFHFKQFMDYRERVKHSSQFKYQLIGPVTLYHLLVNKNEIEFSELSDFLLNKYSVLVNKLKSYGDLLFVLDEPLLSCDLAFYENNHFINTLISESNQDIYIHCCDKINTEVFSVSFKNRLHLDFGINFKERANEMSFLGIDSNLFDEWILKYQELNRSVDIKYVSPSCGLGVSQVEDILSLPVDYSHFVERFNLLGHQS